MDKDSLLVILNHFIEFQRGLEQLVIDHTIITIVYWIVDHLVDAVVAIKLLQLALIDATSILFLQGLNVQNCVDTVLLKNLNISVVERIRPDENLFSISFLDEEGVQEVCIAFVTDRIDDENSICVHLVTGSLL